MKSSFKCKIKPLSLFILMTLAATPANAQDVNETIELAPIEVNYIDPTYEFTEGTNSYLKRKSTNSTNMAISIKETPQVINVLTSQQMKDTQVETMIEALRLVPGVYVAPIDAMRASWYFSRGLVIDSKQMDGLPYITSDFIKGDSINPHVFFFDNIEVTKGATGLINGVGDPSATINLVRKRPLQYFQTNLNLSVGRWNFLRQELDVSTPITAANTIRARFGLGSTRSKTFQNNTKLRDYQAFGALEFDLGPSTQLRVGLQHQRDNHKGVASGSTPYYFADGSLANLPRDFNIAPDWAGTRGKSTNYYLSLDHKFANDWLLKFASDYTKNNFSGISLSISPTFNNDPEKGLHQDGSGLSSVMMGYPFNETRLFRNTLQLSGQFDLWQRKHDFVIGGSSMRDHSTNTSSKPLIFSMGEPVANLYNTTNQDFTLADYVKGDIVETRKLKVESFYLSTRLSLTDKLKLTLGTRYYDYNFKSHINPPTPIDTIDDMVNIAKGLAGEVLQDVSKGRFNQIQDTVQNTTDRVMFTMGASTPRPDKFRKWVPYAGITYDVTPDITLYTSYTGIYKPNFKIDHDYKLLPPQSGHSYELGLKQMINPNLLWSATLFHTKLKNVSTSAPWSEKLRELPIGKMIPEQYIEMYGASFDSFARRYRVLDGKQSINGIELNIAGAISENWNISAGYTLTDKKFKITGFDSQIPVNPKHQFKLMTSYTLPANQLFDANQLTIGGNISWQSRLSFTPSDFSGNMVMYSANVIDKPIVQKSVVLVGGFVNYKISKNVETNLTVSNLFDKKYYANIGAFGGNTWAEPRNVRFTIRSKFN